MKRAARGGPRDATSRCRSCWETSRYSSTRCRRRDRPRRWVTMRYRNSLARQFVTRRARVSGPILTVSPVARSRIEGLPMRNRSRPSSAKEKERKKTRVLGFGKSTRSLAKLRMRNSHTRLGQAAKVSFIKVLASSPKAGDSQGTCSGSLWAATPGGLHSHRCPKVGRDVNKLRYLTCVRYLRLSVKTARNPVSSTPPLFYLPVSSEANP